jgi:hypothetical protein
VTKGARLAFAEALTPRLTIVPSRARGFPRNLDFHAILMVPPTRALRFFRPCFVVGTIGTHEQIRADLDVVVTASLFDATRRACASALATAIALVPGGARQPSPSRASRSAGYGPAVRVPYDFSDAQRGRAVLPRGGGERVIDVVGAVVVNDDGVVAGSAPARAALNQ